MGTMKIECTRTETYRRPNGRLSKRRVCDYKRAATPEEDRASEASGPCPKCGAKLRLLDPYALAPFFTKPK